MQNLRVFSPGHSASMPASMLARKYDYAWGMVLAKYIGARYSLKHHKNVSVSFLYWLQAKARMVLPSPQELEPSKMLSVSGGLLQYS